MRGRLAPAPDSTLKNAGAYRLYWETATPPGTAVRLQVRCAATKETLVGAAFVGPDGTDQTFFEDPGASFHVAQTGFLQYRVVKTTKDPSLSPYLKRVVVSQAE